MGCGAAVSYTVARLNMRVGRPNVLPGCDSPNVRRHELHPSFFPSSAVPGVVRSENPNSDPTCATGQATGRDFHFV